MGDLQRRLSRGEQAAFAELYDLLADRLYGYLLLRTSCEEEASDLLQETFTRLFCSRDRLGQVESLSGYCFTVARRELYRWLDKRRQLGVTTQAWPTDVASATLQAAWLVDRATEDEESAEQIQWALARIPLRYREVIELKYFAK